ncbi:hypothetical protein DV515_00006517, partial [Chloebia gouldiae]
AEELKGFGAVGDDFVSQREFHPPGAELHSPGGQVELEKAHGAAALPRMPCEVCGNKLRVFKSFTSPSARSSPVKELNLSGGTLQLEKRTLYQENQKRQVHLKSLGHPFVVQYNDGNAEVVSMWVCRMLEERRAQGPQ